MNFIKEEFGIVKSLSEIFIDKFNTELKEELVPFGRYEDLSNISCSNEALSGFNIPYSTYAFTVNNFFELEKGIELFKADLLSTIYLQDKVLVIKEHTQVEESNNKLFVSFRAALVPKKDHVSILQAPGIYNTFQLSRIMRGKI